MVPSGRVHSYKYFIRDTRSGETRWQPGINNVIAVRRGDEALEVRCRICPYPHHHTWPSSPCAREQPLYY